MQDALANKKTIYFKSTLLNTVNELKVAVWAPWTPNQFQLHVHTATHACKKMRINTSFANTKKDIEATILDVEIIKGEYL